MPTSYPTIPSASEEVRAWFRRQILSAHYVVQAKGFEALRGIEERQFVMRGLDTVFNSVRQEMLDAGELSVGHDGWVGPGPNIPDHPVTPPKGSEGFRPGHNLSPLPQPTPEPETAKEEAGPACPNCGAVDVLVNGAPAKCPNCQATITCNADGYFEIEIALERERELFETKYGVTPEKWLDEICPSDTCTLTASENGIYYRAMLLERRE